MAVYVRQLAGKHDDLNSNPRAHMVKEILTSFPLTSTECYAMCVLIHTHI